MIMPLMVYSFSLHSNFLLIPIACSVTAFYAGTFSQTPTFHFCAHYFSLCLSLSLRLHIFHYVTRLILFYHHIREIPVSYAPFGLLCESRKANSEMSSWTTNVWSLAAAVKCTCFCFFLLFYTSQLTIYFTLLWAAHCFPLSSEYSFANSRNICYSIYFIQSWTIWRMSARDWCADIGV